MPSLLALTHRIAAMSFDEIRTRARMAICKRLDLREAQRGINPLEARHASSSNPAARFYFAQDEAPVLAAEVRRRLPADWESVIDSARKVQQRRFDLLGYRDLSFGDLDISWKFDPVHNNNSPNVPWFRVPYLDFNRSGDHKIVWELSRHQHLMLPARAWLYTGDPRFLATLQDLWLSWR